MENFANRLFYFVYVIFILFAWWFISHVVSQTYLFWKDGIEKQAMVIALERTSASAKGGFTFYYKLNIEGHYAVTSFRQELPVSTSISVLVLPSWPNGNEIAIGTKSSSLFEIFSNYVGGDTIAVLYILFFGYFVIFTLVVLAATYKRTRHRNESEYPKRVG